MELEAFELVLLRRPPDARDYDDETLERIQAEHLAYMAGLRQEEKIVTNGPVLDQPDESLRGLASTARARSRRHAGSPRAIRRSARAGSRSR